MSDLLICVEYLDRSRLELVSEWRPYLKVVFGLRLLPLRLRHSEASLAASASPLLGKSHSQPSAKASLEISRGYSITGSSILAVSVAAYICSNAKLSTF